MKQTLLLVAVVALLAGCAAPAAQPATPTTGAAPVSQGSTELTVFRSPT